MSGERSRLDVFLDAWEEDVNEGKTIRALHGRLDSHEGEDERRFTAIETEIAKGRERAARESGRAEAHRSHADFPAAPRPSWLGKVLGSAVTKGITKALVYVLAGSGGAVAHYLLTR